MLQRVAEYCSSCHSLLLSHMIFKCKSLFFHSLSLFFPLTSFSIVLSRSLSVSKWSTRNSDASGHSLLLLLPLHIMFKCRPLFFLVFFLYSFLILSHFLSFSLLINRSQRRSDLKNNVDLQIMRVSRIIGGLPCTPVKMCLRISVKTCLKVTGTPVKFR